MAHPCPKIQPPYQRGKSEEPNFLAAAPFSCPYWLISPTPASQQQAEIPQSPPYRNDSHKVACRFLYVCVEMVLWARYSPQGSFCVPWKLPKNLGRCFCHLMVCGYPRLQIDTRTLENNFWPYLQVQKKYMKRDDSEWLMPCIWHDWRSIILLQILIEMVPHKPAAAPV